LPGAERRLRRRSKDRKMENPVQFLQEVRSEGAKVTWPTRKETLVTTGGVFVMVLAASAFFFIADQVLHYVVGFILGIGR
jgi:preprotein translocase subunit SecE